MNSVGIFVREITVSQDPSSFTLEHISEVTIEARVAISSDLSNPHTLTADQYLKLIGMALLGGMKNMRHQVEFELMESSNGKSAQKSPA